MHQLRQRIEKLEEKHNRETHRLREDLAQSEKDLRYCEDDLFDCEDKLSDSKREAAELKRQLVGRRGQQAVGEDERPAPQGEGGESGSKRQRQQSVEEVQTRAGAAAGKEEGASGEGAAGQGLSAGQKGKIREEDSSLGEPSTSTTAAPTSECETIDMALRGEIAKKDAAAFLARLIIGTEIHRDVMGPLEEWVSSWRPRTQNEQDAEHRVPFPHSSRSGRQNLGPSLARTRRLSAAPPSLISKTWNLASSTSTRATAAPTSASTTLATSGRTRSALATSRAGCAFTVKGCSRSFPSRRSSSLSLSSSWCLESRTRECE